MKIGFTSSILEIISGEKVFELFYKTDKRVMNVSDFLKLEKEYIEKNENLLSDIVRRLENAGFKMDYDITEEELENRNKMRSAKENALKEKRKEINLSEELDKKIFEVDGLKIGKRERKILIENGIETIRDLISLSHFELYKLFKLSFVKNIEKYLNKSGLEINMINSFGIILNSEDFKEETIKEVKEEPAKEIKDKTITHRTKVKNEEDWYKIYRRVKLFHDMHKHIFIPKGYINEGKDLSNWLGTQKKNKKIGKLPEEYVTALEEIDIIWEDARKGTGREMKNYILTKNNIKEIKLENGEAITIFNDGKVVSTGSEEYQRLLSEVDNVETIEETQENLTESSDEKLPNEDNSDIINTEPQEETDVKNAEYFRRVLSKQDKTQRQLNDDIKTLTDKVNSIKSSLKYYQEYSAKYNTLVSLLSECIELGELLGEEKFDIIEKLNSIGIPEIGAIITMSTEEIQKIVTRIDETTKLTKEEIINKKTKLEDIENNNQQKIEDLKALREKLIEEASELSSQIPYFILDGNESFSGNNR